MLHVLIVVVPFMFIGAAWQLVHPLNTRQVRKEDAIAAQELGEALPDGRT